MSREHTPQEVWSLILDKCRNRLSKQTISTWLKPSQALSLLDKSLTVELKNKFTSFYVEQNYQEIINNTASETLGRSFEVNFVFKDDKNQQTELWDIALGSKPEKQPAPQTSPRPLKKRSVHLTGSPAYRKPTGPEATKSI